MYMMIIAPQCGALPRTHYAYTRHYNHFSGNRHQNMNDDPQNSDTHHDISSQQMLDHTIRLEAQVADLKNTIAELESANNRLSIEAKLSIQDAELARSFSKKNYAPLLDELFHNPSKTLKKQTLLIVVLMVVTLTALIANLFTATSTPSGQPSPMAEEEFMLLHEKIDALANSRLSTQTYSNTAQHSLDTEVTTQQEPTASNTEPTPETLSDEEIIIQQQTNMILNRVDLASSKENFPLNYASNKTSMAQLYLITMQNAADENIYYESYLEALKKLGVNNTLLPKSIDALVELDTHFLHAAYSAYTVTLKKLNQQWRYRDSDQQLSSYYNPSLDYDLGNWKISSETRDYQQLPAAFTRAIKRISSQLAFNKKTDSLSLPQSIYYLTYPENNKNQAIKRLLKIPTVTRQDDMLKINTQNMPIEINSEAVTIIQERLAEEGFMPAAIINGIAGPKTKNAIASFRQSKSLPETGGIDQTLLSALNIQPTFTHLNFE
jgi:hypothetical protein